MSSNKSCIARGFLLAISASICMSVPASCLAAQFEQKTAEADSQCLTAEQALRWRSAIRTTLFVPDPLPQLAVENHGRFEPAAGVVAERVSYATQFAMRVPAIVYSPRERHRELPALVIVNGHGGDK